MLLGAPGLAPATGEPAANGDPVISRDEQQELFLRWNMEKGGGGGSDLRRLPN